MKRNGKIEFLRFVFCILIILYHCSDVFVGNLSKGNYDLGLSPRGYIGVEFFFLLSGFLMAANIARTDGKEQPALYKSHVSFFWGKLRGILPYHIVAFICLFLLDWFINKYSLKKLVFQFLSEIPSILLIQKAGFNYNNLNSYEWYISAMLVAMLIIYPLCKRWFMNYSVIVAPISGVLILGVLFEEYDTVTGVSIWMGVFFKCVARAIAELNLGIFAYQCVQFFNNGEYSKKGRRALTFFEILCWCLVLVFVMHKIPQEYEVYAIMLIFVGVVLSFSKVTKGNRIFDNRVVYFLGKYSLSLYLNQKFALNWASCYMKKYPLEAKVVVVLTITFVMGLFCMVIGDLMLKKIKESSFNRRLSV